MKIFLSICAALCLAFICWCLWCQTVTQEELLKAKQTEMRDQENKEREAMRRQVREDIMRRFNIGY